MGFLGIFPLFSFGVSFFHFILFCFLNLRLHIYLQVISLSLVYNYLRPLFVNQGDDELGLEFTVVKKQI